MSKLILVCSVMGLMSACALDDKPDGELDAPAARVEGATEAPSEAEAEACMLAESLDDGELAVTSCLLRAPVNIQGEVVRTPEGVIDVQACTTYYGSCTGISGCSKASGGGNTYTVCGSFLYAWLTVCDGNLTGYGQGLCLW